VLLAAAVVVGLGQLLVLAGPADPASAAVQAGTASAPEPTAAMVTVGAERTVWDLARRLEPAAAGPRHAVLAERIVVLNHLTSVELRPGQVLRVPSD
jgi:nucleoid-associated protein YgaU